jgi:hypothetical protein
MTVRKLKTVDDLGNEMPLGITFIKYRFRTTVESRGHCHRDKFRTREEAEQRVVELRKEHWSKVKLERFNNIRNLPAGASIRYTIKDIILLARIGKVTKSFSCKYNTLNDIPKLVEELVIKRLKWCTINNYDDPKYALGYVPDRDNIEEISGNYRVRRTGDSKHTHTNTFEEALAVLVETNEKLYTGKVKGTHTVKIAANKQSPDLPIGMFRATRKYTLRNGGTRTTLQIEAAVHDDRRVVFRTRLTYDNGLRTEQQAILEATKARDEFLVDNPEYCDIKIGRNTGVMN